MKRPRIVTIGGGTGNFTVLSGLKKYPVDLTAVVAMADDGGSTGILRDELGVLPPGDIRQCLVALSEAPDVVRALMNFRFPRGKLRGHTVGNLLLSGFESMTGDFEEAIERAANLLSIRGHVIPSTLSKVTLCAALPGGKIVRGESKVRSTDVLRASRFFLEPRARVNPRAVRAIKNADLVIIGPGDFYSSLVPNFLVAGIARAIRQSSATVLFVCNIMTRKGQTTDWTVVDFVRNIESFIGRTMDVVLYNDRMPSGRLLEKYARQGEQFIITGSLDRRHRYVGAPLVSSRVVRGHKGDPLPRTLIRHDADTLAAVIMRRVVRR